MGLREIVLILILAVMSLRSCAEPHASKWQRPPIVTQDYSSMLMGIEQRLRALDSIRQIVSKSEISLQSLSNRMDLIETRLQTVQNSFQHTFEAVSTAVKSSEMKYELLIEQLSRKLEGGLDRLSHRLTSVESRQDTSTNKIQAQMDIQFSRVENKQNSLGNEIMRMSTNVDTIRGHTGNFEEKANQTLLLLTTQLKEIRSEQAVKRDHLKNITSLVMELIGKRSEALGLSDAPVFPQEGLKMIRAIISEEAHKIGAKLHNMYNDLWKTVKDLEVLTKNGFEQSNNTSRELYNKLTEMLLEEQRNSESFIDVVMRSVLTSVGEMLGELQRQVDSRFKEFKSTQEMHGESCHKIKTVIENRVAVILEKIYDTFINRTDKVSKHIVDVAELLKAHNKQLTQSTTETSNLLVTLAEESSQDHKQLDSSITDVAESCQDLQVQTQEINDLLLKNEATIKEIKGILLMYKDDKSLLNISRILSNDHFRAIEANYSNGIIKIKTEPISKKNLDVRKGAEMGVESLNKTISTSELEAIIGEPRREENGHMNGEQEGGDEDFEAHEETSGEEAKPVDVTQLLLAYIKLLHEHLSPQEFLAEAVPGNTYDSFHDMIAYLKKANNVPRETIHDIEQLAQEQIYKDSLQTDREIGRIIKKLQRHREVDSEDENYDDED